MYSLLNFLLILLLSQAYGQSKLANILFARELSDRFSAAGITSNSLHPGTLDVICV